MSGGLAPVKYDLIRLKGGLDQVTPNLSLDPGYVRRAFNFECSLNGGYGRVGGYERFDGRPSPSAATYSLITVNVTGALAVGDTITGATSAATGKVIYLSGTQLAFTKATGTFVANETLNVGGTGRATITSLAAAALPAVLDAQLRNLAADDYRADIGSVPGEGQIRGVCWFNNKLYAWRNNVGSTAKVMFQSSGSGWTALTFGEEVSFSNANTSVTDGDTLTQGGVTATIARVVVQTGTLLSGTNTGRLIITGRSGGNLAAGAATSTGGGSLTISGAQTAITMSPGGLVETSIGNFGGGAGNRSMYGIDGVGRAFEFDGTVFVPISTTMTSDVPTKVCIHKNHLFLAFGDSLQFSSIGNPYSWAPLTGAGEISMVSTITNLVELPGDQTSGALGVFTRNESSVLYGTSSSDFALASYSNGTGAISLTAQAMEQVYMLDDRGVMTLTASQNYGNFATACPTVNLRPFLSAQLNLATASVVSREKSQYRLFFSDGTGLFCTFANGSYIGSLPVNFPNVVRCTTGGENAAGAEVSFFGSDNGNVYQLDSGTSFDGAVIDAYLLLTFGSSGGPRLRKRYRKASVEMTGSAYATFSVNYSLAYDSQLVTQPSAQGFEKDLRSSYWDEANWSQFVWDGGDNAPVEVSLSGTSENISFQITSSSDLLDPFVFNSIMLHYSPRRSMR